ncbi:MAG: tRNA threonylcarbamoyladenosine dehydratase [Alphaproteobacteria bacterium]|nr:tRNA threonylcarbamoyladenosine dehydratase [Alphaproteobacteria bacterium]
MTEPLPSPEAAPSTGDGPRRIHRRWDRLGRLLGDLGVNRLQDAHVVVIGLGGVGSWAAEALARSGVGRLTLVDFDLVCVTNINRQLPALRGTVGQPKAKVLAERLRLINPESQIKAVPVFYEARTSDMLLGGRNRPDFVVDAIDNVTAKCHLLAECRRLALPVVCCTGASGRLDPTRVAVADLADTTIDPLASAVRKILRKQHGFPAKGPWGIPAVYSTEHLRPSQPLIYDGDDGFSCVCPNGENDHHGCESRSVIWGTAGFVTGAFGFAAASVVVQHISGADPAADASKHDLTPRKLRGRGPAWAPSADAPAAADGPPSPNGPPSTG